MTEDGDGGDKIIIFQHPITSDTFRNQRKFMWMELFRRYSSRSLLRVDEFMTSLPYFLLRFGGPPPPKLGGYPPIISILVVYMGGASKRTV